MSYCKDKTVRTQADIDQIEDKLENKKGYSPLIFTKKKKTFRRVKFNLPQSILRKTTLEE